jgi:hypothetical protein
VWFLIRNIYNIMIEQVGVEVTSWTCIRESTRYSIQISANLSGFLVHCNAV